MVLTVLARACALALLMVGVATSAGALEVGEPIVLIADDAQVGARVASLLSVRYASLSPVPSLDTARAAARAGGPAFAVVLASHRDRGSSSAYGVSLARCQVQLEAQLVDLVAGTVAFHASGDGTAPDCRAATDRAVRVVADRLLRGLALQRPGDTRRGEDFLWIELAAHWSEAERQALREVLPQVPGITRVEPDSGPRMLKVAVFREPAALVRDLDRVTGVRVGRFTGRRLLLTSRTAAAESASLEAVPLPLPPVPANVPEPLRKSYEQPAVGVAPAAFARRRSLPERTGKKWALVIGISEFVDASINDLSFPVRDAEAFARTLRDPAVGRFEDGHVVVLRDEEATTRRIKLELDYLARMSRPEDLFVFFVSSHAVPGAVDTAGDAYIVTHDTEKAGLYGTALPMRELVDALENRIRARTVVAFLDACHTGEVVGRSAGFAASKGLVFEGAPEAPISGKRASEVAVTEPAANGSLSWQETWKSLAVRDLPRTVGPAPPVRNVPVAAAGPTGDPSAGKQLVFVSSSDGTQLSWESQVYGHGFFTYFLTKALEESAGLIPIGALFDYLEMAVRDAVRLEWGQIQEPRMFVRIDNTDFPIGYPISPEPGEKETP